jgi:multidrug transporter EmrE-like cation transporter
MEAILFLISSVLCGITGQLMLKRGMNQVGEVSLIKGNPIKTIFKMFTSRSVLIGVLIFGVSMVFWIFALSGLELSYAYPMVSISYVLIALGSKIFFKENVSLKRWISIIVICIGVILVSIT